MRMIRDYPGHVILHVIVYVGDDLIGSGGAFEGAGHPDRVEDVEILGPSLGRQLEHR